MARRAAEVVAARNLVARLESAPASNRRAERRVHHHARIVGFRYVRARELPGGSVEATVEIPVPQCGTRVVRHAPPVASVDIVVITRTVRPHGRVCAQVH
jgi:hypothetical protein